MMKTKLLILFVALAAFCGPAMAQADLPYLPFGERYDICLAMASYAYPLSGAEKASVLEKAETRAYDAAIVRLSGREHLKLPAGKRLRVVGYARSREDFGYDLYVVILGDDLFYLSLEFVDDNGGLEKKNDRMVAMYNELPELLEKARERWKALAVVKAEEVEKNLRRVASDERRIGTVIDSLVTIRTAGIKDAFEVDSIRIATDREVRDGIRDRRALWTARKEYLVNPGGDTGKVAGYYAEEIAAYRDVLRLQAEISAFEERNHLR